MKLSYLDKLPENFFEIKINELNKIFKGPTLITLEGENNEKPLFISTLLHGNETTGFLALQRFLKKNHTNLPRTLILFIGNIQAAVAGVRHLDEQEDYNRIWDSGNSEACVMAREVFEFAKKSNIIASIDIHNNTGKNPYYACVNRIDHAFLELAYLFNDTIIYFTQPHEVFSNAFAKICPSLTLECGLPGEEKGIEYVNQFLDKIFYDYDWGFSSSKKDYKVYYSMARIKLPLKCSLDFDFDKNSTNDYSLLKEFDELNFKEVLPGTALGYYQDNAQPLCILDSHNRIITNDFFDFIDNTIVTNRMMIPSMFTKLISVAKSDSLGYIMVKYQD